MDNLFAPNEELQWITDRLPTEADAMPVEIGSTSKFVWLLSDKKYSLRYWYEITPSQPWCHIILPKDPPNPDDEAFERWHAEHKDVCGESGDFVSWARIGWDAALAYRDGKQTA